MATAISTPVRRPAADLAELKHRWIGESALHDYALAPPADSFSWKLDGRSVFLAHYPDVGKPGAYDPSAWATNMGVVVLHDHTRGLARVVAVDETFAWIEDLEKAAPSRNIRDAICIGEK